jgi:hypothetical protein
MANGLYQQAAAEDHQNCCFTSYGQAHPTTGKIVIGNYDASNCWREVVRFALDIPVGATIDSAYLFEKKESIAGLTINYNPDLGLLDQNNVQSFVGAPAYSRDVVSAGIAAPINWSAWYSDGNFRWARSPDLKAMVQYFVEGHCAGGAYAPGQYIGFMLRSDSTPTAEYFQASPNEWQNAAYTGLGPFLVVSWSHPTMGVRVSACPVMATGDDTYNSAAITADNHTSAYNRWGTPKGETSCVTGIRWAPGIAKAATINAAVIIGIAATSDVGAFTAQIGTLEDESTFGTVQARAIIGSETAWPADTGQVNGAVMKTPDIAARIAERTVQADYDPVGAGDAPYVGIRIRGGDSDAEGEARVFLSVDWYGYQQLLLIVKSTGEPWGVHRKPVVFL